MFCERRLLAVAEAAGQPFHRVLDGLALALGLGRRERLRRIRGGARDRVLELTHTGAERATDLRQPPAAQKPQSAQQDEGDGPGPRQSRPPAERSPFLGPEKPLAPEKT